MREDLHTTRRRNVFSAHIFWLGFSEFNTENTENMVEIEQEGGRKGQVDFSVILCDLCVELFGI